MAFQNTVHNIDSGAAAKFLKIGMVVVILIGLCMLYFLVHFKGLGTEAAMDQAQIARSLVQGEGYSTRYIRPLAIRMLNDAGKETSKQNFPEFFNAPLYPLLEAVALYPVKNRIQMDTSESLSMGDRVIAAGSRRQLVRRRLHLPNADVHRDDARRGRQRLGWHDGGGSLGRGECGAITAIKGSA